MISFRMEGLLILTFVTVVFCASIFSILRTPSSQQLPQRHLLSLRLFEPDPSSILAKIPKPSLELVHITKTGGSAIEEAAAVQANIHWGACHYCDIPRQHCRHPDWSMKVTPHREVMPPLQYVGEPWHMPPHWQIPNRYLGKDTFAVIRNPYDRVISEYGCSAYGYHFDDRDDPAVFNQWVQGNLTEATHIMKGHMLPQHFYIYDTYGDQLVTHILQFETLHEEFDALMKLYDLPVRLPRPSSSLKQRQAKRRMTIEDLTPESIRQINDFYQKDFDLLPYPMVHI